MVCLLCCECGVDDISLSSSEGVRSNISSVLFKYFRFVFECEPVYGEICRKCWIKVEMFHVFYEHIEEIQTTLMKVDPLVVVSTDFNVEDEDSSIHMQKNERRRKYNKRGDSLHANAFYDSNFIWQDELYGSQTNDSLCTKPKSLEPNRDSNQERLMEEKINAKPIRPNIKTARKTKKNAKSSIDIKSEASTVYSCPINRKCNKFESKDGLIAHCAMDHKRFHCTHCPNIRLFADLYKHLRDVHGIIENAICEHCGQTFGCNRTLQEHIKRKHTVSDPVQCDICKEWFKSRETIRSHMNYVHIQGPQTCGICGKVSANRKALRTHLTIHSEAWKDKYKCVICGKGFRSSTKLREHSYIHSGKTDAYICQFCGKSFRFNSSISTHRMKYHPAEMAHVKERLQKKRNMEFKV